MQGLPPGGLIEIGFAVKERGSAWEIGVPVTLTPGIDGHLSRAPQWVLGLLGSSLQVTYDNTEFRMRVESVQTSGTPNSNPVILVVNHDEYLRINNGENGSGFLVCLQRPPEGVGNVSPVESPRVREFREFVNGRTEIRTSLRLRDGLRGVHDLP